MTLCLSLRQNIFSDVEDILINLLLLRLTVACLLKISLEHLLSTFNSWRLVTKEQHFFYRQAYDRSEKASCFILCDTFIL